MGIKGGAPNGRKSIHWRTEKIPRGGRVKVWVAGDAIAVTVHPRKPTKPCLKAYNGVLAECPGCAAQFRVDGLYYLPVYLAPGGEPRIVWLHEDQKRKLAALANHQCISLIRPMANNEGLQIGPPIKDETYCAPDRARELPQDISEALVTLWGYRDRVTAAAILRGPIHEGSDNAVSQEAAPKIAADERALTTLVARGAILAAGGDPPPVLMKEAVEEVNRRFVEASRNGHHKKPK